MFGAVLWFHIQQDGVQAIHDFGGISEYFKFRIIALEIKWYYRVTYGGIGDVIDYFSFGLVE